ncbi:hypothetical protein L1049_024259 [Liquidambar formosana]|uniref:BHLH domain-containing protein n=1 Tax=Liquidambar formosana TaxID=63359 RepID=A0AAP0RVT8_LIQFO
MERDLQAAIGGGGGWFRAAAMGQSMDDACFDAMCSSVSLSTLLNANSQEKSILSEYDIGGSSSSMGLPVITSSDPATFAFFSEEFPALSQKQIAEGSTNEDQRLRFIDFMEQLKMPKDEPLDNAVIPKLCDSNFSRLPELQSLEPVHDEFSLGESSQKRVRSCSSSDSYTLDAIVRSFKLSSCLPVPYKAPVAPVPSLMPQSSLARQRRQRVSDKTRYLQKLMPWDRKMDMATMLEEAYKYVKFLQAQISVLQSMPSESTFAAQQNSSGGIGEFGGLGRLNRQQLLQVLVNSPVAQTMLYSQGCCVFSVEQLVLLKKMAERRILMQHFLFDPSKLS